MIESWVGQELVFDEARGKSRDERWRESVSALKEMDSNKSYNDLLYCVAFIEQIHGELEDKLNWLRNDIEKIGGVYCPKYDSWDSLIIEDETEIPYCAQCGTDLVDGKCPWTPEKERKRNEESAK